MSDHKKDGNVYWAVIQTRGFSAASPGEAYDLMADRMIRAAQALQARQVLVDAGVDIRLGDPGGGGGGAGVAADYYIDLGKFNISEKGLPETAVHYDDD